MSTPSENEPPVAPPVLLPDVVDLCDVTDVATSPTLLRANAAWRTFNGIARGLWGTGISWLASGLSFASAYPRVAVLTTFVGGAAVEETVADTPVLGTSIEYTARAIDPKAAAEIFDRPPTPGDPVGEAAKALVATSTAEFLESPEYGQLQADVQESVGEQMKEQALAAAGMTEQLAVLKAEQAADAAEAQAAIAASQARTDAALNVLAEQTAPPPPPVDLTAGVVPYDVPSTEDPSATNAGASP